ncbi:MAG: GNAT family N-acetyltransferase [Rhodocyclaceae bacterium]|nr:GNAT family N-acetyltransferase [Rhodocyclaceae bacterium]
MTVSVDFLRPSDAGEYDRYLASRADGLFYHCTEFKRYVAALTGGEDRTLVARRDGRMVGALPLMAKPGPFGTVLNSMPYYGSNGGPLFDDPDAAASLAGAYGDLAGGAGIAAATVVENPFARQPWPDLPQTCTDARINQSTDLGRVSGGSLAGVVESSALRNARKARRHGIRATLDEGRWEGLWEAHRAGMEAIGARVKTRESFALLGRFFAPGSRYRIYVAELDGAAVAFLLLFYFNGIVEYYVPATVPQHRELQPMAVLLEEAMLDAANRGFHTWNWGGTWLTQDGVYRFKEKWGAVPRDYRYRVRINDDRLLERGRGELEAAYPNFYVCPYALLRGAAGATDSSSQPRR